MLRYDDLCRHVAAFPSLTGMTRAEFDSLLERFVRAEDQAQAASRTTSEGQPRRRAPGAGRPHDLSRADRLLMALVWLRVDPTDEVLGFFFDRHKRNAQLHVRAALAVLDSLDDFPFDRPTRDRAKCRSVAAVMAAFPQVRLIIDAKEQRTNRPKGDAEQKPYYSGKKKCHPLQTQVAIDPSGRIESVSASVPGSTHDLKRLIHDGLLGRLAEGEGSMADKGYVGVEKHHPDVPVVLPCKKPRGRELTAEQKAFNRAVSSHRMVVEHTMAPLNRFTVLRQVFRAKRRERHSQVARVVAILVNRRIALRPLKSYAA
jgi:hypothetical protein